MPRYMHQFSYSTEAVRGLTTTPHNRKKAAAKLFKDAGGELIDIYYCFGDYDGIHRACTRTRDGLDCDPLFFEQPVEHAPSERSVRAATL